MKAHLVDVADGIDEESKVERVQRDERCDGVNRDPVSQRASCEEERKKRKTVRNAHDEDANDEALEPRAVVVPELEPDCPEAEEGGETGRDGCSDEDGGGEVFA